MPSAQFGHREKSIVHADNDITCCFRTALTFLLREFTTLIKSFIVMWFDIHLYVSLFPVITSAIADIHVVICLFRFECIGRNSPRRIWNSILENYYSRTPVERPPSPATIPLIRPYFVWRTVFSVCTIPDQRPSLWRDQRPGQMAFSPSRTTTSRIPERLWNECPIESSTFYI